LELEEVDAPGSGLVTLIAKVPAELAEPVAVSCEDETNVVCSTDPDKETCAPLTNLLPVIVMEKLPVPTLAGLMPVRTGVGFRMVAVLVADLVEEAELVARMVTELGFGRVAGAV